MCGDPSFKEYLTHIHNEKQMARSSFKPDELLYTTLYNRHTAKKDPVSGEILPDSQFVRNFHARNPT